MTTSATTTSALKITEQSNNQRQQKSMTASIDEVVRMTGQCLDQIGELHTAVCLEVILRPKQHGHASCNWMEMMIDSNNRTEHKMSGVSDQKELQTEG
jgi:hypothetical protein